MVNRDEMGKKSKESTVIGPHTRKYGKMQGNEMIYGPLILRMVGPFNRFEKVAYFDSYLQANKVFYEWMEENK
jgi:hypothetical protein